jgi:alpha/beta superfamily hydrolase
VVVGGQDELVDADEVSRWTLGLNPPAALVSLPLASHFFHGELTALCMAVHAELLTSFS